MRTYKSIYKNMEVISILFGLEYIDMKIWVEVSALKPETIYHRTPITVRFSSDIIKNIWLEKYSDFEDLPFTHKALNEYVEKYIMGSEWLEDKLETIYSELKKIR